MQMLYRLLRLFLFIIIFGTPFQSALASVVKTDEAEVSLFAGKYDEGGTITAGLKLKLADGWKVYWRDAGDTGFPPQLTWDKSDNIDSMEMLWPHPKRNRYKLLDNLYTESYEYENEVVFPLYFNVNDSDEDAVIDLHVYYAICNEICIPANADLKLNVQHGFISNSNLDIINKSLKLVPKENGSNGVTITAAGLGKASDGEGYLQVDVVSNSSLANSDIFIESNGDYAFYNPKSFINNNKATFNVPYSIMADTSTIDESEFTVTIANGENSVQRLFVGNEFGVAKDITDNKVEKSGKSQSVFLMLLFAFIGGLILNIMPCVLPVLSIKLIGVIKHGGGQHRHVVASFLATAFGIVVSFLFLGALVFSLKTFGVNVGWGFHFQEPIFIITLIVILSFFAANMWGFYEFSLPSFLNNKMIDKTDGDSFSSHFFTGVFATVLATPCTAPFLGTAVGFALSGSFANIFSVFFAMGVGLAFPYLVLSVFPSAVTKLPKPGLWMVKVKCIMGAFIALTAFWLLWVLSNQLGISAAISLSFIILIILTKLHSCEKVVFYQNAKIRRASYVLLIVLAFIVPNSLKQDNINNVNDDNWVELNINTIDQYLSEGRVVFVDVTADWCLTCKANKLLVLDTQEIEEAFKQHNVVTMRGDWTNKNEYIASYLKKYDRAGIPFNIIYGPSATEGIIMSEVLSKQDIVNSLKKAKAK